MPGAEALVRKLKSMGVKIAVATSAAHDSFSQKRSNHGFFDLFDVVICGDNPAVKRGKPNPDIFLVAARSLGIREEEYGKTLVFEDALFGVQAAKAAKMGCVAVVDKRFSIKSEYAAADVVIDTLEEFDAEKFF